MKVFLNYFLDCIVILRTRIGNTRTVIISDYKLAKEAMAHPDVADRPLIGKVFQIDPEDDGGKLKRD